jgi:hypothetical protein
MMRAQERADWNQSSTGRSHCTQGTPARDGGCRVNRRNRLGRRLVGRSEAKRPPTGLLSHYFGSLRRSCMVVSHDQSMHRSLKWFVRQPPSRASVSQALGQTLARRGTRACALCPHGHRGVVVAFQTGPPVRPAPRLARAVGSVARERTRRRRARSCAQATPNPTRSAGPKDPSVSSMGMPPTWAVGTLITGRSPWCSRRPGGGPRGRARDRRGGRGSRRRSPGRSPCRRRASS